MQNSEVVSINNPIVVEDYNPQWKEWFNLLSLNLKRHLRDTDYIDIIHLGSTSIPGLAAKPIIDMFIVVEDYQLSGIIQVLSTIGYDHQGDLGIKGREAFRLRNKLKLEGISSVIPPHNLYTLINNCDEYVKMTLFKKFLLENPKEAKKYGQLKKEIAHKYSYDEIDDYISEKGELIVKYIEHAMRLYL